VACVGLLRQSKTYSTRARSFIHRSLNCAPDTMRCQLEMASFARTTSARGLHQSFTELHGSSRDFPIYPIARSSLQSKSLSVPHAQDVTAIETYCDNALSDHPAAVIVRSAMASTETFVTPQIDNGEELWKLRIVLARTGLSTSMLYAYVAQGLFPKQRHLGPRRVAWLASEVLAWMATLPK
jgi:prophage regulatory protein